MKSKFYIFFFIIFFVIFDRSTISEEFNLKSNKIEITEKGNKIEASGNVEIKTDNNILIKGDKTSLNKNKSILIVRENVEYFDKNKNIKINSDFIKYDKKNQLIVINGDSKLILDNKYTLLSSDILYDKSKEIITSKSKSILEDQFGNKLTFKEFNFYLIKEILKVNSLSLDDIEGNNFKIKEGIINLNKKEIVGKDIKVYFDKSILGNEENDPRLFGNSINDTPNKTIIRKGVFTSCKIRDGDKCPPWLIKSEKITHDKKKKIISYKNAWLNLYDVPVLYFPYISHPDPTVKRQSGFLLPSIKNSSLLGSSLQLPYYKVLSDNKDLTFSPRLFFNDKKLFQTEYRQREKNTNYILDHSINFKNDSTNSHFFGNILKTINNDTLKINIQTTSDRTYLKKYEIESPLISNYSYLNSLIEYEKENEDSMFNINFEIFEDLSKKDSDAYEYVYPNYNYEKNLFSSYNGDLLFNSSGYQKKYDTNKYEGIVINDLRYNSMLKVKQNGITNNFSLLIKNINFDGDKSDDFGSETNQKFLSALNYNLGFPLLKKVGNNEKYLTPKLSARFSPTETKNIINDDNRIDYIDLFDENRINRNDMVEGGESLTLGFDYSVKNENKKDLINFSAGQVFRKNGNSDLPRNSSIGNKRSDVFGKLSLNTSELLDFNYSFALDKDLKETNYNLIETGLSVNNFVTKFNYLESSNLISQKSYISNETTFKLNKNSSLGFSTNKNLDQNLTEYYDVIYEYKNDCLIAALEYKKSFYKDADFEPSENIFFSIKLIPFGGTNSQNIN